MIWVWMHNETGMPNSVQKCDFEPTIHPKYNGRWYSMVEKEQITSLQERINVLEDTIQENVAAIDSATDCIKLQRERIKVLEAVIDETKFFLETVINEESQYSYSVGDDGFRLMANGEHHAKDLLKRLNEDFSKAARSGEHEKA